MKIEVEYKRNIQQDDSVFNAYMMNTTRLVEDGIVSKNKLPEVI